MPALADQVAATFLTGGPAGFAVEKWTLGEAAFDAQWGMFRVKLQAHCRGGWWPGPRRAERLWDLQ